MKKDINIENAAKTIAATITNREYDDIGNSRDVKRETTEEEKKIIYNIAFAALSAVAWDRSREGQEDRVAGIISMAEFAIDQFFPSCNGYSTIYRPLERVILNE